MADDDGAVAAAGDDATNVAIVLVDFVRTQYPKINLNSRWNLESIVVGDATLVAVVAAVADDDGDAAAAAAAAVDAADARVTMTKGQM